MRPFAKLIPFVLSLMCFTPLRGQEAAPAPAPPPAGSPVNLEPFAGTRGMLLATNYSKPLAPSSRFGIFAITEFYGVYQPEEQLRKDQFMGQAHLTFALLRNLRINAGAITDHVDGFRPTAGIQYHVRSGDLFILFAPRIDLSQGHNGELFGFAEYTPRLKGDWKLYGRVQGLYNQNLELDMHAFSYVRLRLGVSYRTFRFGAGANYSTYGPFKVHEDEYGLFLGALLF
ncbi:MAG: hypothetical protein J5I62_06160 [Flavobacteriales bacterium]|nr:hypothetical protein [Flavobacteriales bacterium]